MRTQELAIGVAIVLLAGVAGAQTNDPLWGAWHWGRDIGAARAAGLGGAFVAIADDASATFLNPAGLCLIERSEVAGGLLSRGSGDTPTDDRSAARSGLGFVGGTTGRGVLGERWALGGYAIEPHAVDADLSGDQYLRTIVTEAGGAVSWRAAPGLYLGARVTATHAEIEGLARRAEGATEVLRVGVAGGDTKVTGSFGVLYVRDALRIGATANAGASYRFDRNATNPSLAQDLEIGGSYNLRQPAWGSAAVAWRAWPKLLVSGQLDWVRYSEIEVAITQGVGQSSDFVLEDAVEPRLGAELSLPVGTAFSLQVRGGLHHRAANAIENDADRATWPGVESATLTSLGAGLVSHGWRIDGAGTWGGPHSSLVATATIQF